MHLVKVAEQPNVTIQVVPFTASLHPGMKGPFKVLEFEDVPDENIVFLESPRGDFISDDPEETSSHLQAFLQIREKSLSPSDSVSRIRSAADEMS